MCLTLLYLVYVFFFRKETYFNFNRFYLIIILIASSIIPIIHVNVAVSEKDNIEKTFQDIGKFRSYYTEFIGFADSEFGRSRYRKYEIATFEENSFHPQKTADFDDNLVSDKGINQSVLSATNVANFDFNIIKAIIAIYLFGVLFFFVRLVILLFWLAKTVKQNVKYDQKEYKLVLLEKEIPPFSFFKYVFVSKHALKLKEYEQVLAHEKVHVGQLHSLDLILAHTVTVFHWFNPLVWNLQKALKTTHEYIADSRVVKQGFELFDYQSLLLSQLVSIQSVELVNNFNLISIKKRIAMMTKNKSRFSAKLKALLVIPMALVVFILFADMTVKSPILSFTNFNSAKVSNLDGIWENNSNSFGKLLLFKGENLSILESTEKVDVIDLSITIKDEIFQIIRNGSGVEWIKYQLYGSDLRIWWNDKEYTSYKKTNYKNSFEAFTPKGVTNIKVPIAEHAKILEKPNLVINIYVFLDKYLVDGVECKLENLKEVLNNRFHSFNKLDLPFITARLVVDENTEMKSVYELQKVMREISLLRAAYSCIPKSGASELQFHASGIALMLPPTKENGAVELDRETIKDRLIVIEPGGDLVKKAAEYEAYIRNHPDYIASYDWKNTTKYSEYIATIDMVMNVISKLRNEYTLEKFNLNFAEISDTNQKEARNKYPNRLCQVNVDEE
jgi:hypothetical protein